MRTCTRLYSRHNGSKENQANPTKKKKKKTQIFSELGTESGQGRNRSACCQAWLSKYLRDSRICSQAGYNIYVFAFMSSKFPPLAPHGSVPGYMPDGNVF